MQLEHRFTVPAPIDVAWEAFNDLEQIAPCFPGATLTSFDGDTFQGFVKVRLGPISLQYSGSGRFVERDVDGHRAVVEAKGKDKRGNGTAAANVTATLVAAGDSTGVAVVTDLAITGRPAQFGRGVMQDVSDKLLGQFADCLEQRLAGASTSGGGEAPASADEPEGPVTAAEVAAAADRSATPRPQETAHSGAVGAEAVSPADPSAGSEPTTSDGTARQSAVRESSAPQPRPATQRPPTQRPATQRPANQRPATQPPATQGSPTAELNLGATVLPVLLRRYAPHIIGGLVGTWVLQRILRRARAR